MELPIDLPGLGHVNCYALEDADGFTLVDPGLAGDEPWLALLDRLQQVGAKPSDVHTVFVTHSHFDHFGGGHRLQHEFGSRIVTHAAFEALPPGQKELAHGDLPIEEVIELTRKRFETPLPWGGMRQTPTEFADKEEFYRFISARRSQFMAVPDTTDPLADGDHITLAGREWQALFTPGHTDDHLCLFDPTTGVLLSGDHVLPTITPHISGMANAAALQAFFDSLIRIGNIDGALVLPAHGDPFDNIAKRTAEIREHHEERLDKVRATAVDEPWGTVDDHMRQLFSERAWGDMAQSEAFAHLEHLRLTGDLEHRINPKTGEFEYNRAGE